MQRLCVYFDRNFTSEYNKQKGDKNDIYKIYARLY